MKILFGLLVVLSSFVSTFAWACHPRADPMCCASGPGDLEGFVSIYVGEVVGIRLEGHIHSRRYAEENNLEYVETGGTPTFAFEVYADDVLKGSVSNPQGARSGDCSLHAEPNVHDRVIVFREQDGSAWYRLLSDADRTADEAYVAAVRRCLAGPCGVADAP